MRTFIFEIITPEQQMKERNSAYSFFNINTTMKKKKEIEFEFVQDEEAECERCGSRGIRNFEDGDLCYQCTIDDAFEQMNDRDN